MNPEEQKPRRGSGVDAAKHRVDRRGSLPGSKPWRRGHPSWNAEATRREAEVSNDRRARIVDETLRPGGGNKPLKGESRTW
jgi:hypothetical protein